MDEGYDDVEGFIFSKVLFLVFGVSLFIVVVIFGIVCLSGMGNDGGFEDLVFMFKFVEVLVK